MLASASTLGATICSAQDLIKSDDPNLIHSTLPNGFSYYLKNDSSKSEGKLHIRFVVRAGTDFEKQDQQGIAHLLEHVLMRGSVNFPDLKRYLDSEGLVFGREYNAGTGLKKTIYEFDIPNNNRQLLVNCLRVIRDWAQGGALLDTASVNAERKMVLQEAEMKYSPDENGKRESVAAVISKYISNKYVFNDDRDNVRHCKHSSVLSFYNDWYTVDNAAIIIVGKINVNDISELVIKIFSDIKSNNAKTHFSRVRSLKLNGDNRYFKFARQNSSRPKVEVLFKLPYRCIRTSDDFNEQIRRDLLSMGLADRLNNLQAPVKRNISDLDVRFDPIFGAGYGPPFSALQVNFSSDASTLNASFRTIMSEIFYINKNGFNESEFRDITKKYYEHQTYKNGWSQSVENCINNFVQGDAIITDKHRLSMLDQFFHEVSAIQYNTWLRSLSFDIDRDVIIHYSQSDASRIPDDKEMTRIVHRAATDTHSMRDTYNVISSMPDLVNGEEQDSLKQCALGVKCRFDSVKGIGIVDLKLSNGVRVVTKKTSDLTNQIEVRLFRPCSVYNALSSDSLIAPSVVDIVFSNGLGPYNKLDFEKYKKQQNFSLVPVTKIDHVGISASGESRQLEPILQAMYLAFVRPRVDSGSLVEWVRRRKERFSDNKSFVDGSVEYQNAMYSEFSNFCKNVITSDVLINLTPDRVLDNYRKMFVNDGNLTVVITGDFNDNEIGTLISQYLGTLPKTDTANIEKKEQPVRALRRAVFLNDTDASGVSYIKIGFSGIPSLNYETSFRVEILRAELLTLAVARLRAKESISYAQSAYALRQNYVGERKYIVGASFDCIPGHENEAITYMKEEMESLKRQEIQEILFEGAKKQVLHDFEINLQSKNFWSEYLMSSILNNEDPIAITNVSSIIDRTTAKELAEMARTFDTNNMLLFILQARHKSP